MTIGGYLPLRSLTRFHRRHEIVPRELAGTLAEGLELREARRDRGLGNAIGMKLLLDVGVEADAPHALDVAGTSAEAEAVQDVEDRPVVRVFRNAGRDSVGARAFAAGQRGNGEGGGGNQPETPRNQRVHGG